MSTASHGRADVEKGLQMNLPGELKAHLSSVVKMFAKYFFSVS